MKQMSKKRIRRALRATDSCTKRTLAHLTGLSIATCGNILNELTQTGEVMESGLERSSGGRPAKYYAYNENFQFSLCMYLDMVDDQIQLGYYVVNLLGRVIRSGCTMLQKISVEILASYMAQLLKQHPHIRTAVIGLPGAVDDNTTIGRCGIRELEGCALGDLLSQRLSIDICIDNDMNLCALGFYDVQHYHTPSSIAVINFPQDSCAGAGIVVNGRVLCGGTNFAGEISYLPFSHPNCSLKEQLQTKEDVIRYAADVTVSICAVIDPRAIVLTGGMLGQSFLPCITSACHQMIPAEHMPKLFLHESRETDYKNGLIRRALERQDVCMGEKRRIPKEDDRKKR